MARSKSKDKRDIILRTAKLKFARDGFNGTAMGDIASEAGLPVGSLYTYFGGKDEIVRVIIDEGWNDLRARLEAAMAGAVSPEEKMKILLDRFIPELIEDLDLIDILLRETIAYTKIEEKLEILSGIIRPVIIALAKKAGRTAPETRFFRTGLVVFFLGILSSVKLTRSSAIGIRVKDINSFVRIAVENAIGGAL